MTLTHINLHAVATKGCGFTSEQLDILGVARPPKRGWVQRLIGTDIPDELYAELLTLKGAASKTPKNEPATFAGYQLPQSQEKPRESLARAVCVSMQVPIDLVETVQGLIRLRDSLAKR